MIDVARDAQRLQVPPDAGTIGGRMQHDDSSRLIGFGRREGKDAVESGTVFAPKFDGRGLIAAITTDASTGEVLMQAWMNDEALRKTLALGEAVYFSRSRNELWHKGATSGNTQKVIEILTDCDQDSLVLRVEQKGGGACHTGARSCFYRRIALGPPGADGAIPALLEPAG